MGNAVWGGVRLKDLLEDAGITTSALEVVANGADAAMAHRTRFREEPADVEGARPGHVARVRDERRAAAGVERLPGAHRGPGWTATYWIKAVTDLTVSDKAFDGFWMKTAYRVPKGMFGVSGFESQDTSRTRPSLRSK